MTATPRERAVRSDSIRNRDAILEAAAACLAERPTASIAEIAAAAGVGRVTLYGHFPSREALIGAVLHHTMATVETAMAGVDLSGEPPAALDALVTSSWQLLSSLADLAGAVEHSLPRGSVREAHAAPLARVHDIFARGRAAGDFRDDQSLAWQVACFFALMHGAAGEVRAGRIAERDASTLILETMRALLRPV